MEPEVCEVIIRFYSEHLMRTLDANRILQRMFLAFPGAGRICFEPMSEAERAEAGPIDSHHIVCIQNRCFVYARTAQQSQRVASIEAEIERENIC